MIIQGLEFEAPSPYAEGHSLTANEAKALNGLLVENLRNNFAKTVEKAVEAAKAAGAEPDLAALQAEFTAYAGEYEFSGKSRGVRAHVDAVTREAQKLARAAIRKKLKAGNIEVDDEKLEKLVADALVKYPSFMEEAKRRASVADELVLTSLED